MIKKTITIFIFILPFSLSFSQEKPDEKKIIQELSENACKCADSISLSNRKKADIIEDVHECINKYTGALQLSSLLLGSEKLSEKAPKVNGKKQINLTFDSDKNSQQYKDSYNKLERYLMQNCESVKKATGSIETNDDQFSKNEVAIDFYHKAIEASKKKIGKKLFKIMSRPYKLIQSSYMPGIILVSAIEEQVNTIKHLMLINSLWRLIQKAECLYRIQP
nr:MULTISPECIES: hypothetical protein [unclassified Chryseobacterium]